MFVPRPSDIGLARARAVVEKIGLESSATEAAKRTALAEAALCGRTVGPAHKPAGTREITLPIAALGGATSSSTSQPRMSNGMSSGVNWMRQASSPSTMPMVSTSLVLARPGRPIAGHDREQIAGAADIGFGLRGRNPPIRFAHPAQWHAFGLLEARPSLAKPTARHR